MRCAITALSTRLSLIRASTKLRSFSRKAHSFATQRSSLSRHQPMYCGWRAGAAVFSFCTLTSRVRQPSGSADVVRSTPSMLKPCCCSKRENSPATPTMRSASRMVSLSSSVMGRMSISSDLVASEGSSYSG